MYMAAPVIGARGASALDDELRFLLYYLMMHNQTQRLQL